MNPSDHLKDILVAPTQMVVGSLDEFRLEVIAAVTRADAATTPHLSVDLRGTQTIDATGLGVLLLLHKRAREKSLKVRLLGPSPAVLEVLRNTRVHLLFEIVAPGEVTTVLNRPEPAAPEFDPHPSVTYPGLSSPFESAPTARAEEPASVESAPAPERAVPPITPPAAEPERATVPEAVPAAAEGSRCPDCGRPLPSDREVQFCPWCGTSDRPSLSAPIPPAVPPAPTPVPPPAPVAPRASAPGAAVATPRTTVEAPSAPRPTARPPRTSSSSAASAVTPSAVTPPPSAISTRRETMAQHSDEFRALLDATQLYHRIDEDGDARIIFPLESGRTQTAWITRNVDTIGEYAFRYVMSFVADAGEIAGNFGLMASLLEQVSAKKGGGLVTRGSMLLYRIPVSTQASPESLAGAVALAAGIADELETAITGET